MTVDDEQSEAGEISAEALSQLNALLDEGPGDDASEEEVAAFLKKVSGIPGGAAMLKTLTKELAEGGGDFLAGLLGSEVLVAEGGTDWSLYQQPQSSLRLVFRVQPVGSKVVFWRRLTLPSDACFFDLHYALQDAFGLTGNGAHRFEWRRGSRIEATFLSGTGEVEEGDDYCEFQNRPLDLFSEGAERLFYLVEGSAFSEFAIFIEKLVEPNSFENQAGRKPECIGGEGPDLEFQAQLIQFRTPGQS